MLLIVFLFCICIQFTVVASLLILSEIIAGILMFICVNLVKPIISTQLLQAIEIYQYNETFQDFVDFIQRNVRRFLFTTTVVFLQLTWRKGLPIVEKKSRRSVTQCHE